MMIFSTPILIRFAHCDPAGIVFYPRYFELINGVVEDWCAHGLGMSFHQMHTVHDIGLPTVHIKTDFVKPSYLGDELVAELSVVKLGRASLTIHVALKKDGSGIRVKAEIVLVMAKVKEHKAIAIPDELRLQMQRFLQSP